MCNCCHEELSHVGFRGMQEALELWTKNQVDCHKQSLKGYSRRSLENSCVENNVEGLVQKALEGNNISNWPKGHSQYFSKETGYSSLGK